jgi:polar amino acid transport system substrate-binding protein
MCHSVGIDLSSDQRARSLPVTVDASPCSRTYQTTVFADRLTVGVSAPIIEPYFIDEDPTSGEGIEASLVYGIAGELGLPNTGVTWQAVAPDATPRDSEVDFIIDRRAVTDRPGITYSAPYVLEPEPYALAFAVGNPPDRLR